MPNVAQISAENCQQLFAINGNQACGVGRVVGGGVEAVGEVGENGVCTPIASSSGGFRGRMGPSLEGSAIGRLRMQVRQPEPSKHAPTHTHRKASR